MHVQISLLVVLPMHFYVLYLIPWTLPDNLHGTTKHTPLSILAACGDSENVLLTGNASLVLLKLQCLQIQKLRYTRIAQSRIVVPTVLHSPSKKR